MKIWRKRVTESVSQLMNHEAVYRTAPATPGLLNVQMYVVTKYGALMCTAVLSGGNWRGPEGG